MELFHKTDLGKIYLGDALDGFDPQGDDVAFWS